MKKFLGSAATMFVAAAMLAGCPTGPSDGGEQTQIVDDPSTALAGSQLYFIPAAEKRAGDEGYSRIVTSTTTVPVPTGDHTDVTFDTNGVEDVALGEPVFYFGVPYDTIFIGSNGTIGLGSVGGGNDSLANHFASPQISVLAFSLEAVSATVGEDADGVVVTFQTVDETIQAEFIKTRGIDGDIRLTYAEVAQTDSSIVGLSNGELADADQATIDAFVAGFVGADLTQNYNTSAVESAE